MASEDRARLAIVGIGNTLAGDDGVGIWVVDQLARRHRASGNVLIEALRGDLLVVESLLSRAERFVFVDAVAGDTPGELTVVESTPRAFAPSLHQTDIGAVMAALKELEVVEPFPMWEVWGIVIATPESLGEGLTPAVRTSAETTLTRLENLIDASG